MAPKVLSTPRLTRAARELSLSKDAPEGCMVEVPDAAVGIYRHCHRGTVPTIIPEHWVALL